MIYGSLGADTIAIMPARPAPAPAPAADVDSKARHDFALAREVDSRELWVAFVQKYPDSFPAAFARERIKQIDEARAREMAAAAAAVPMDTRQRAAPVATAPPPPPSQPSQASSPPPQPTPRAGGTEPTGASGQPEKPGQPQLSTLIRRAQAFIGQGDISAARSMLKRAADAGDASAALLLGATYDPNQLKQMGVVGIKPDIAQARAWYTKAGELGSAEAPKRITLLPP